MKKPTMFNLRLPSRASPTRDHGGHVELLGIGQGQAMNRKRLSSCLHNDL